MKDSTKPTANKRQVGHRQQRALLVQAVRARADQRRDRQVEREVGGGLARQPEQHAADDGGAAAAGARDHRQRLHQADLERVPGAHLVDVVNARGDVRAPFGPEDHEAAEDEGAGHHRRREQVRLDRLAEQQPQNHRGHERDQHVEREALRLLLGRQRHDRVADLLPVDEDHREDGAGLDRDVEDLGLLVVEAQQRARQDQVAGARNRKELGQPFDHPHHRGLGQQYNVHARSSKERALSLGRRRARQIRPPSLPPSGSKAGNRVRCRACPPSTRR